MPRTRHLNDPATGRTWTSHCADGVVETLAGSPGRERRTRKEGAGPEYALKQEWARLRKGFVLTDPMAAPGEPVMHRYLGPAYTGAMVAEAVEGRLLCNRFDDTDKRERLLLVDEDGGLADSVSMPAGRLAWQARHVPELKRLLVRGDHQVFAGPVPFGEFEALTAHNRHPVSFLGGAGTRAVWYAEPDVVVTELADGSELFRETVPAATHGGHSLQMEGALSPDGTLLAYCARPGEVIVREVADGRVRHTWSGGFAMVAKLLFTPDGTRLIAQDRYGTWRWHCLDLTDGTHPTGWPLPFDSARGDLAIDAGGDRLAVSHRDEVQVLDLAELRLLLRFPIEHSVRRSALTWVGDGRLGVLTDAGMASLYAVETVV
ncbi:WD40 repeat domain-containing protein [Streptomyces sp. NPDC020951]|uniref:WD40 repeat domain-containing protein n=1 Tax=Streptomyces sp. NPDC020951 TaxID=3365104 RepID=UPI00378FFE40